jgi:S-formylglutathione hydrolase FrmB
LRYFIAFLPSDSIFAAEVCGLGGTHDQLIQINQRCQIDPRRAYGHAGANHRINHPPGDHNYDARRT